jgi:hypothetical protein
MKLKLIYKQSIVFILLLFVFSSCENNEEKITTDIDYSFGSIKVLEIDSCEYIIYNGVYKSGIVHKHNCKFCTKRDN